jgi:hypothetical protein
MKPLRATPGWLTGIALAAVAAVNLAGLGHPRRTAGRLDELRNVRPSRRRRRRRSSAAPVRSPSSGPLATVAPGRAGQGPAGDSSARRRALAAPREVVRIGVRASDSRRGCIGRRLQVPVLWIRRPPGREQRSPHPPPHRPAAATPQAWPAGSDQPRSSRRRSSRSAGQHRLRVSAAGGPGASSSGGWATRGPGRRAGAGGAGGMCRGWSAGPLTLVVRSPSTVVGSPGPSEPLPGDSLNSR